MKIQIFGLIIILFGLIIVFIGQYFVNIEFNNNNNKKDINKDTISSENISKNNIIYGLFCLLITIVFQGFQMVYQERNFNKYEINIPRYVGLEGIYGLIFSSIILSITSFIKCEKGLIICPQPINDIYFFIDNISSGLIKIYNNYILFIFILTFVLMVLFINGFGLVITNKLNALSRLLIYNMSSIIIWIIFLFIPNNDEYLCIYQLIKLFGFILYIFGLLMYNKIFNKEKLVQDSISKYTKSVPF